MIIKSFLEIFLLDELIINIKTSVIVPHAYRDGKMSMMTFSYTVNIIFYVRALLVAEYVTAGVRPTILGRLTP